MAGGQRKGDRSQRIFYISSHWWQSIRHKPTPPDASACDGVCMAQQAQHFPERGRFSRQGLDSQVWNPLAWLRDGRVVFGGGHLSEVIEDGNGGHRERRNGQPHGLPSGHGPDQSGESRQLRDVYLRANQALRSGRHARTRKPRLFERGAESLRSMIRKDSGGSEACAAE
jgi:hypothetical protein